jgi:hypothetical protein
MSSRSLLCILLIVLIIVAAEFPKMKKVRINIAPKVGIQDREVLVDIRFDADNRIRNDVSNDSLLECVNYNCAKAQETLKDQGFKGTWRANIAILDRVMDFYKNKKQEAA